MAASMTTSGIADGPVPLRQALLTMLRHPVSLLADWNWKAGAVSGILHGLIFFIVNLRAGSTAAAKAMLVEALYSILTAGLAAQSRSACDRPFHKLPPH